MKSTADSSHVDASHITSTALSWATALTPLLLVQCLWLLHLTRIGFGALCIGNYRLSRLQWGCLGAYTLSLGVGLGSNLFIMLMEQQQHGVSPESPSGTGNKEKPPLLSSQQTLWLSVAITLAVLMFCAAAVAILQAEGALLLHTGGFTVPHPLVCRKRHNHSAADDGNATSTAVAVPGGSKTAYGTIESTSPHSNGWETLQRRTATSILLGTLTSLPSVEAYRILSLGSESNDGGPAHEFAYIEGFELT